ncbi:hypothetical protein [Halobaculum sp. D14]|uniref:hypothetical protein n=1 Tax=unclassified Halobaculum TaxID=2640896 RepID=UPI003EBB3AE7
MTALHVRRAARHTGLFALHQLTVLAGILLFPLALLGRRAGVVVPLSRVVDRIHAAYAAYASEDAETDG